MACWRHCGLCPVVVVTCRSQGPTASRRPSIDLLAVPAGPSLTWSLLHRYVGHDTPGYGHQGIYQFLATVSGLKHIRSEVSSAFKSTTRVTNLAGLPGTQVTCPPKTGPGVKLDLGWMKGGEMPMKEHTPEQVVNKLREAEVAIDLTPRNSSTG